MEKIKGPENVVETPSKESRRRRFLTGGAAAGVAVGAAALLASCGKSDQEQKLAEENAKL
jgi:hypothetical protein